MIPVSFQLISLTFELHEGHGPTATVLNPVELHHNDGAGFFESREKLQQFREARMVELERLSLAIEAQNVRRAFKGTEHDSDATVFFQVRDGFDAGSAKVQPGDGQIIDHDEAVIALGRQIDMSIIAAWRGRDEKHVLLRDEGLDPVIQFIERLGHYFSFPSRHAQPVRSFLPPVD